VLVRTGGRYPGARGGGDRSWLLIKHKDEWAGDLDITEFAPKSVKSEGDFEDILAADNPAIWHSHRPAKGGDTGAMFARIIERAAEIQRTRQTGARASDAKGGAGPTKSTKGKTAQKAAASKRSKK